MVDCHHIEQSEVLKDLEGVCVCVCVCVCVHARVLAGNNRYSSPERAHVSLHSNSCKTLITSLQSEMKVTTYTSVATSNAHQSMH